MSEMDDNTQGQKRRSSKLAIFSLVLGIIGFLSSLAGILSWPPVALGRLLGLLLGLLLGILALHKIKTGKGLFGGRGLAIAGVVLSVTGLMLVLVGTFVTVRSPNFREIHCAHNLRELGLAMTAYADNYAGKYPEPDRWCGLLLSNTKATEAWFVCDGALLRAGRGRCHYAINPHAEPNSPGNTVLLFETKGGWNQFGGPEILSAKNHKAKGCNVLFNDKHVELVRPDQIGKLNWTDQKGRPGL
jgi:hypothetical protein